VIGGDRRKRLEELRVAVGALIAARDRGVEGQGERPIEGEDAPRRCVAVEVHFAQVVPYRLAQMAKLLAQCSRVEPLPWLIGTIHGSDHRELSERLCRLCGPLRHFSGAEERPRQRAFALTAHTLTWLEVGRVAQPPSPVGENRADRGVGLDTLGVIHGAWSSQFACRARRPCSKSSDTTHRGVFLAVAPASGLLSWRLQCDRSAMLRAWSGWSTR